MTYVEASVVFAQALAEDQCRPKPYRWTPPSRLTEYEVWSRIHPRGIGSSHGESVRLLLGRLAWLEVTR